LAFGGLGRRATLQKTQTPACSNSAVFRVIAQSLAARVGLLTLSSETQYDLIRRLSNEGAVPREVKQVFDQIRINGNAANHALEGNHAGALSTLKLCWQLALWFHRTFKDAGYKSGPFVPPQAPVQETEELQAELARLREAVGSFQAQSAQVSAELHSAKTELSSLSEERAIWEQLATDSDKAKAQLSEQLASLQAAAVVAPATQYKSFLQSGAAAATQVQLDEAETRRIIDEQLRQAGWEADTEVLRYSKGTRPEQGCNIAIAEWPCEGYSADYVMFQGLTPLAVVEAKREAKDVSAALQQSKRYSRTFGASSETILHDENWGERGEFRIPFVFATNGALTCGSWPPRAASGSATCARPENRAHALDGWYSPGGSAGAAQP
jgi:type I restriction enzyme R subunit